jgi:uncharacterized protein (TIGR04540 family)
LKEGDCCLEVKMFYKSQVEVSKAINELIDTYWDNQLEEDELFENIKKMLEYNEQKIIKNNDFTTVLKQKCGKRRLEVMTKILELIRNKQ